MMAEKLHHFYYNRNKKSLSKENYDKSADYGQHIEPHGEYMNVDPSFKLQAPTKDWEAGTITFKNPLYLEHKDTSSHGWKKDLSEMFENKTGKELSNAIKKKGHDAIITKNKHGYSETVNLGGKKNLIKELPRQTVTSENKAQYDAERLTK